MSVEDGTNYEKTKAPIIVAYELVPEAYRSRFRKTAKHDSDTWVEFVRKLRSFSWVGEIGSRAPPGQLNSEIIFSTPRIST